MFNLFKKKESVTVTLEDVKKPSSRKKMEEIIEEIHENFFTEVDRLLADSKIANSLETDMQDLIDKSERLTKLGFRGSKEVNEAKEEIQRLRKLEEDNSNKTELIEAINYFSFKYPTYKFITEESVKKICEKYGLIYGGVERYIGVVPEKNLKEIEAFKINEEDECWTFLTNEYSYYYDVTMGFKNRIEVEKIKKRIERDNDNAWANTIECGLEIAAPESDFRTSNTKVVDYKMVIEDPVVLKPVSFKNKKYYLVVTAWGLEASDQMVINEKLN